MTHSSLGIRNGGSIRLIGAGPASISGSAGIGPATARVRARMFVLGLTGSLGMGKSTTAGFFAEEGVAVHDADAVVHRLYEGEAVAAIEAAFPGTTAAGKVDRVKLAACVLDNPEALRRLEAIVHPLVRAAQARFLADAKARGAPIVLLDIPLLFETASQPRVDGVVVVSAPSETQRQRVLERPGMTPEKFDALLARQIPDAEKRRRADFVVDTSQGFDAVRAQVKEILRAVANMPKRQR
jgi:dephospho-CoA kinase